MSIASLKDNVIQAATDWWTAWKHYQASKVAGLRDSDFHGINGVTRDGLAEGDRRDLQRKVEVLERAVRQLQFAPAERVEKYTKLVQAQTPKDAVADLRSLSEEMADYVTELEQCARIVRVVPFREWERLEIEDRGGGGVIKDAMEKLIGVWARQQQRARPLPPGVR